MKHDKLFSNKDLDQIKRKGIDPNQVLGQLKQLEQGFASVNISSPAAVGNGILQLSSEEVSSFVQRYEESDIAVMKFVPASGAASRMFKDLFAFADVFDGKDETLERTFGEKNDVKRFFNALDNFAFYEELNQQLKQQKGVSIDDALKANKHNLILDTLLNEPGLSYGQRPKGLLSFHKYDNEVRSAAQEHLQEGLAYAKKNNRVQIHFTISSTHRASFEKHISKSLKQLPSANISVSFSEQHPSTDTIASTPAFRPLKDESGNLLFRPAGHGALLKNLNDLRCDLIFIKNIDNVVPDRLKGDTIKYKKVLAGALLYFQEKIFTLLRASEKGMQIKEEGTYLLKELGLRGDFSEKEVYALLNRPIRVCGMVKNDGEPGGGPFWVKKDSLESLQIVESAQIDKSDEKQRSIFRNGSHFNPVDIVCGTKNHKGEPFDLLEYRDNETGFIAEKSFNGKQILALELPGLWNGGMANWNTLFIEVPQVTFNPVKTITDLLQPAHV
ncbi:MAG: DUF4301 family protein [Ekhidna sp.]